MARHKPSHAPSESDLADRRPFPKSPREVFSLLKVAGKEFIEDRCPKQAAALAYYTLFALGPLLVLAIGIAALVFSAEAARGAVMGQLERFLGSAGGQGVADLLTGAQRQRVGVLGTVLGSVVLVFAAGAVFAQLKEALNRIWEVQAEKAVGWKAKVVRAIRKNFLSFAGIMGAGFLLLVSLLVNAALTALSDYVSAAYPVAALVWQVLHVIVSLVIVSLVFGAIFRYLPDTRVAWRDVFVGAVLTAILFLVGQVAIGYYLGAGTLASRYGAASAVLVILVWVYYSSLILFFGAELTQVYANRYGSRLRAADDARSLREAVTREQSEPEKEGTVDEERRKERRRAPG